MENIFIYTVSQKKLLHVEFKKPPVAPYKVDMLFIHDNYDVVC